MKGGRPGALLALVVLLAFLLSVLWYDGLERPAVPILLVFAAVAGVTAVLSPGRLRGPAVACAATLLALAVAEGGLELRSLERTRRVRRHARNPAETRDPVLGWRQRPGVRSDDPKARGTRLTIGPTGFRVGSSKAAAGAPVVLVLGDSFGYGLHLPDEATMPYVLEERLGGRLDVANLAMTGWGPHQTVALLEVGLERSLIDRRAVAFGIYFAVADAFRPTGQRAWTRLGPWYVLGPGGLRLQGDLADRRPWLEGLARRTALGERAGRLFWPNRPDPELYAALLSRMAGLFARRHHAPLAFVLDPGFGEVPLEPLLSRLRAAGAASAVSYRSLFPGGSFGSFVIPDDGHPNAAGAARVAEYLAGEIERLRPAVP